MPKILNNGKERFYLYLLASQVDDLEAVAKKAGKTRSEMVTLAVTAGLEALKLAFNPSMDIYFKALEKHQEDYKQKTQVDDEK